MAGNTVFWRGEHSLFELLDECGQSVKYFVLTTGLCWTDCTQWLTFAIPYPNPATKSNTEPEFL